MGRKRQALKYSQEGALWVVRFRHPLRGGEVVRLALGADSVVAARDLVELNTIFLNRDNWNRQPAGVSDRAWEMWGGESAGVKPGGVTDADAISAIDDVERQFLLDKIHGLEARSQRAERTLVVIHKQRVRVGPSPTLEQARADWVAAYQGRDSAHAYGVGRELLRFVAHFGAGREVDSFIGNELELAHYLRSLGVGPGRRNQIRLMVLRFLEDSGAMLDRPKVPAAGAREVRAKRGPIRWLERGQATALAEKLPAYWAAVFRVQVGLGLRPDELPTLRRDNFARDLSTVTLAPFEHLTLKTGSRSINVPMRVREIIRERLEGCDVVFPQMAYRVGPNNPMKRMGTEQKRPCSVAPIKRTSTGRSTGRPWETVEWFDRKYLRELRAATAAVNADKGVAHDDKIGIELDARIGRRTCGSLLLRAGMPVAQVAAVLGDDAETVREHYARIISGEVDPSAAGI